MSAFGPFSIPSPTPETREFWDATKRDELLIQRCSQDGAAFLYWRKKPFCPSCGSSDNIETVAARGTGFVYSFVIDERGMPGILPPAPHVIALVELDEGPRLVAALEEIDPTPDAVTLDLRVQVRFDKRGEEVVPYFIPEN